MAVFVVSIDPPRWREDTLPEKSLPDPMVAWFIIVGLAYLAAMGKFSQSSLIVPPLNEGGELVEL